MEYIFLNVVGCLGQMLKDDTVLLGTDPSCSFHMVPSYFLKCEMWELELDSCGIWGTNEEENQCSGWQNRTIERGFLMNVCYYHASTGQTTYILWAKQIKRLYLQSVFGVDILCVVETRPSWYKCKAPVTHYGDSQTLATIQNLKEFTAQIAEPYLRGLSS